MILKRVYFLTGLLGVFWLMEGPAVFGDAGRHYGGLLERYLEAGLNDPETLLEEYLGPQEADALAPGGPGAEAGGGLRNSLTALLQGRAPAGQEAAAGLAEQLDAVLGRGPDPGAAASRPVSGEPRCRAWYESSTGGERECLAWSGG